MRINVHSCDTSEQGVRGAKPCKIEKRLESRLFVMQRLFSLSPRASCFSSWEFRAADGRGPQSRGNNPWDRGQRCGAGPGHTLISTWSYMYCNYACNTFRYHQSRRRISRHCPEITQIGENDKALFCCLSVGKTGRVGEAIMRVRA